MTGSAALAEPPPEGATLDQLKAAPAAFAGHRIEVSGQLDECWNFSCHLCPAEATPADPQWDRCLAIDFDRFRGGEGNRGADMDSAFRYADVTVTARFDPACLTGVCADGAPVLLDARVERVTRRRTSNDGLMQRPDPLVPVNSKATEPLADLIRPRPIEHVARPVQLFGTSTDPTASKDAVVCISWARPGEPPVWPTTFEGAVLARSTEDPWRCWTARKEPRGWVLEPR
ncbi:MAG: hypothetical protein ACM3ZV_14120 [Bacillota bacterium]